MRLRPTSSGRGSDRGLVIKVRLLRATGGGHIRCKVHTVHVYWCARAPTRYHTCSAPHPGKALHAFSNLDRENKPTNIPAAFNAAVTAVAERSKRSLKAHGNSTVVEVS